MRYIMFLLFTCALLAHAGDTTSGIDLTAVKEFTLSIEQTYSATGDQLTQIIDVSEGESFRIVTTANGIRWTTKGVVGKPEDNTISVQLTTEWYKHDTSNQRGMRSFDLNLSGEKSPSGGPIHGLFVAASIKRNEIR